MPLAKIATATVIAAVLAVIANVLLRALAVAVLDIPQPGFEPLETRAVITSTAGGVIVAGIVYAIIDRLTNDPVKTFRMLAVIALAFSLYAPIALLLEDPPENPGTDGGSVGTLILMHVISAAIAVVALTGGGRGRGRDRDPS